MSSFGGERIGVTFEIMVGSLLVLTAGALVTAFFMTQVRKADEGVLKAQLRAYRTQQRVFTVVHGRMARDLKELVNDSYSMFPLGGRELEQQPSSGLLDPDAVRAVAVDAGDHPIDPWGNRYVIDPATGRIHSVTEGYEDW